MNSKKIQKQKTIKQDCNNNDGVPISPPNEINGYSNGWVTRADSITLNGTSELCTSKLDANNNNNNNNNTSGDSTSASNSLSSLDKSLNKLSIEQLNGTSTDGTITYNKHKPLQKTPSDTAAQVTQHKKPKFPSIIRLSNQAGSFFSRSCPGEDIIVTKSITDNHPHTTKEHEKSSKTFFLFSNKATNKLNNKQSFDSSVSDPYNQTLNGDQMTSSENHSNSSIGSIGNFQVDMEQLTKELYSPSIDKPLTSYKPHDKIRESKVDFESTLLKTIPKNLNSKSFNHKS